MSECVVRMEMPKSCPCELAGGYDIPLPCFAGHGIPKRCKEFDECVENGRKPDWCPFICALPEGHGRLVDADVILQYLREKTAMFDAVDGKMELVSLTIRNDLQGFIKTILETPTIVPAERSET